MDFPVPSSQLPANQFAQQHGLKLGTLYRWLHQERQNTEASAFQEVRLEIAWPDGVVVRLGAAATPAWFRLRDALAFPASFSLRPTGVTGSFLTLPAIAGRLRISGTKRVRIFGTQNIFGCTTG
jgi:hypothetical protein